MTPYEQGMSHLAEFGLGELQIERMLGGFADAMHGPLAEAQRSIVLSNDPARSSVEPHFIVIPDIDTLKRIGGIPDARFQSAGWEDSLPKPLAATPGMLAAAQPHSKDICAALYAYVYGDSSKVTDYRDSLNRLRFPMKVAVFAAENVVVTRENPLIIEDAEGHDNPVSLVFGKVTIMPGGQIIWKTTGKLFCDSMEVVAGESGQLGEDPTPNLSSVGGNGGNGGNGSDGGKGNDGNDGQAGKDNKNSCAQGATNGTDGTDGTDGSPGQDGAKGADGGPVNQDIGSMGGHYVLSSQGGNGGNGGKGGNGGDGGKGGKGGASTSHCGAGKGGDGGNGGNGAMGGNGGNGGNGMSVYITYSGGNPTFTNVSRGGDGGTGGTAGNGGAGGASGTGSPPGTKGQKGSASDAATPGEAGKAGSVHVNGIPI